MGIKSKIAACAAVVAFSQFAYAGWNGSEQFTITTSGLFNSSPFDVINGAAVGYANTENNTYSPNAILWTGSQSSTTATNLNFSGTADEVVGTVAVGAGGSQQVGYGYAVQLSLEVPVAVIWSGSSSSAVLLQTNVSGSLHESQALATTGSQQVGWGDFAGASGNDALLWTGTATSMVNLAPTNLTAINNSEALGTDGTNQVGYGNNQGTALPNQALLWSGTGASAVNLTPTGFGSLNAFIADGVSGTQQVGYGYQNGIGGFQAFLWKGTAASAVDLNPTDISGVTASEALATNGSYQAGYVTASGTTFAAVWNGNANSAVDLQNMLPGSNWSTSEATSVDSSGNVYGWATNTSGATYAVEWSHGVPEPGTGCLLLVSFAGLLARRRRSLHLS
jgi:hypothetical protein